MPGFVIESHGSSNNGNTRYTRYHQSSPPLRPRGRLRSPFLLRVLRLPFRSTGYSFCSLLCDMNCPENRFLNRWCPNRWRLELLLFLRILQNPWVPLGARRIPSSSISLTPAESFRHSLPREQLRRTRRPLQTRPTRPRPRQWQEIAQRHYYHSIFGAESGRGEGATWRMRLQKNVVV
jgi:hypothetical protein